ncbi:diguanylate cyclase [Sphingomonas sp. IW22]|uniref:diguanylate cyclase n=1 Tax=Sphingomonas sp. IW22 TaxID=3242489 RepID=UPI0035217D58
MYIAPRLRIFAASMIVALLPTTVAIVAVSQNANEFLLQMDQRQALLDAAVSVERAVIDTETAQRGFLLSGVSVYKVEYHQAETRAAQALKRLSVLARDVPEESERVIAVIRPARSELALLDQLDVKGRDAAMDIVRNQAARFEAQQLRQAVQALSVSLDRGFEEGAQDVRFLLSLGRWLAIAGVIIGMAAVLIAITMLGRYLRHSVGAILGAMRRSDESGVPDEVTARLAGEFREVGETYNQMCVRMRQEIERRDEAETRIAELLNRSGEALAHRRRVSEILARIANRLPACLDQQELVSLASRFIPQLFDIRGGALYFQNNSATVLTRVASWGDCTSSQPEFAPTKCWALRRGQQHQVADVSTDVTCGHLSCDDLDGYVCMPLIAQGDTVGLLYLEAPAGDQAVDNSQALEDMRVLCENLALALVNLRLRESLRHQSLRDPLTGLHNRRYLEETIDLEFAKSRRHRTPVSVILADIDHFKHINDTHGHDTGDIVLRKVASTMGAHVRKGDVACRYGGEEFLILLPGLEHGEAVERAELLREQIRALSVRAGDADVGQITASFGVATFTGGDETPADIVRNADHLLYEAKAAGRDRVHPRKPLAVVEAAEAA